MEEAGEHPSTGSEERFREWMRRHCEQELWFFARWALEPFGHPESAAEYLGTGDFHRKEVCPFITDYRHSRFKLLMLPMGSGKTSVTSRALPLHAMVQPAGKNIYVPHLRGANMRVLLANENTDKSKENLNVLARHAAENPWLYWLWPSVFWKDKKESPRWKDEGFELKREGAVFAEPSIKAIGMNTGFIGGYYDIQLLDDIATNQAAMNPPTMERCKKFRRSSMTRRADKRWSIHIGVGTHWDADDVYLEWKKDPRVDVLIRSIVEWDEDRKCEVAMWPEKYPLELIEEMRKGMEPTEWSLWYLNKPVAAGFTALRWEDLRQYVMSPDGKELYFTASEMDDRINQRYQRITRNLGFVLGSQRYDPANARQRTRIPGTMDKDFVEHMRLKNGRCEVCGAVRDGSGPVCEHTAAGTQYGYRHLGTPI
jgi:hypothetical protein